MKREFSESDLKTLYQAMLGGMKRKQVIELMGFTEAEHDECYHQARLKFSKVVKAPRDKPKPKVITNKPKTISVEPYKPFKRPKAEYSNRSPYGIASPGIIRA
jgi:hypothetical protein